MSTPEANQTRLIEELDWEVRQLVGEATLFHQAIADRLGLHASDLKCLELLLQHGPLTAGRLATFTGLTTSSITALIDRLEKVGYARRGKDPQDRRKVVVEPIVEKVERDVVPLFQSMGLTMRELYSQYSNDELALFIDFIRRTHPLSQAEIEKLRAAGGEEGSGVEEPRR